MDADWLLGWWNLIFLIPLGLALAYLFAYTLSGWTFGDADVDLDADADVDLDIDADVDVEVDVDGEVVAGHPHHDIDADSDVGAAKGFLAAFTPLGVGKVPLSIVMMVLFLTFGMSGFASNQLLREGMGSSGIWISLPIALLLAFGVTSGVSHLIARFMPLNESSARSRGSLIGRRGVVVFAIDAHSGMVAVVDEGGDRYQVAARVAGDAPVITTGTEVVLTRYDTEQGLFFVKATDLSS